MGLTATAVATSVAVGKALYTHTGKLSSQCEVIIHNKTGECLLHDKYKEARGTLDPSVDLPPVAPGVIIDDPPYPGEDYMYFPQVVAMSGKAPPAIVMQWKFAGRDLYLFVFVWMGALKSNTCFFKLRTKPIPDLEYWWDNVKAGHHYFETGDLKRLTATVDGIVISGEMTNENPAQLDIHLEMADS